MSPNGYPVLDNQTDRLAHHERVRGVITAGDVRARDERHHFGVTAETIIAEALSGIRVDVEAGRPETGNRHDYPRPPLSPLNPQGAKLLRPEAKQFLMDRDGCPVLCDHLIEKTIDRR